MKQPPKVKTIKAYLPSLQYYIYKAEANKRAISMSELIKVALYDFIYRPLEGIKRHDIPILRVDRTPKGSTISKEKSNFKQVIHEIKSFDLTTLEKVPEKDKRHIYNIMVRT